MKELKTYKKRVYKILDKHETARDNDNSLWAYYIQEYHSELMIPDANGELAVSLKNFKHLPPFESITRARRIIQNDDGNFLPTKESVRNWRGIKEKNYRNAEVREAKLFQI